MLDGMFNFKTHFMVWYCVWYEHCNGLFNIRNLVSSLILFQNHINIFFVWYYSLHLIWEEMEATKKILRLKNMFNICLFF